jgi:hypothetical protein
MTTIAFDGRYLAADTLAHRHNVPSNLLLPKIDMCDGFAYAVSGSWLTMLGALIAWHRAGAQPRDFPNPGELKGGMLVIEMATARMWVMATEGAGYLDEEAAPFTCGSGGDYALAAMDCDRTAMEAVKLASKRDLHTNDIIDFIDIQAPEMGMRRWDGIMPSAAYPMPKPAVPVDVSDIVQAFSLSVFDDTNEVNRAWHELRVSGKTAGDASYRLRAALRSYLSGKEGVLHWRNRPESWSEYLHDEKEVVWHAYARLVVVPKSSIISKAEAQALSDAITMRDCDWARGHRGNDIRPCGTCQGCVWAAEMHTNAYRAARVTPASSDAECEPITIADIEVGAREVAQRHNGLPLTTALDMCAHGFVRRTCSSCRGDNGHARA